LQSIAKGQVEVPVRVPDETPRPPSLPARTTRVRASLVNSADVFRFGSPVPANSRRTDEALRYTLIIAQESTIGSAAAAVIGLDRSGDVALSVVRSG
jgi:hypothetical protein